MSGRPAPRLSLRLVPVVFVTTLVQALASMIVILPATIAPELARAHGVDTALIGIQVSVVYIGAMTTSVVGGAVVRRFGPLRCSQIALACAATGSALTTLPLLTAIVLGAVFIGFGYGLTNPPAAQMLMKVTKPSNRNLVFSIKQTGVPLGGVAAGLLAPSIALTFGWQTALLSGAAFAAGVMVVLQPLRSVWDRRRDPDVRLSAAPLRDVRLIWAHRNLRMISLGSFTFSAMQVSLTTFAVAMLVTDIKLSLIQAGLVLAVLQVSGVSGRIVWGWVADRLGDGNRVLSVITLVTVTAAILTRFMVPDTPLVAIYAIMSLFGFTAVGWNGVYLAEIARLAPPELIGSATGAALFVTFFGVVLGPAAFAGMYSLVGSYASAFGLLSLVLLVGLVFVQRARQTL